ncbi:MAG TPA: flagellar assembly protein FliW [Thermodesulfobacteriaceae bacterium]|nr:flagellar assembly protein FliW [Thermodesulfobacteriaceae bacterium]
MNIETTRFGPITIDRNKILTMEKGIPGFPDERRYVLLPHHENSPFYWLQSIDNAELAFVVVSPFSFCSDYSFEIPEQVREELKIDTPEQIDVLVLVTISADRENSITANLLGPLVINMEKQIGCQLVLDPGRYPLQYPLSINSKKQKKRETEHTSVCRNLRDYKALQI